MIEPMITLTGRTMSAVIEPRGDAPPVWRWWGGTVDARGLPSLADTRPAASFSLDIDQPLAVVPAFGTGWFGPPALRAHRDGRHSAQWFETVSIETGDDGLTITLVDRAARLTLVQRIAVAGDLLTLSGEVVNDGEDVLEIEWLAAGTLPLPGDCAQIHSFTGRHNAEFVPQAEPMPAHGWVRENRRGLTGHAGPPGLFVSGPASGWHAGRVHAAQLAWSGNHRLAVERDDDGVWVLQMGEALAPGEIRLAPGDRYATPEMLATCSGEGLNCAMQAFHAAIRARAPWPAGGMRSRPVHVNSWEGFYFDHDEAALMALADRSAALGVERFVLDDGWFKGRDDDTAALGDWVPDPVKYPRGLRPLAAHIVGLGMEFGLWVEPEMINPDSDLARAHPDWALHVNGVPQHTSRNQLVLDLGRSEVRDYLFARLHALLTELPIAYLKWDHNRDLAVAGGADGRAGYHAQVRGAYALFDRLGAAHPALEIEACAGGGGRIDAGIAARTHRFWTSDCIDAVSRVRMQRGFLHFMPPEMMGAHVGASPAHSTGRSQGMAFRAAVALPGHFGVELDPATMAETDAATLAGGIARYKALRDRLHHGRVWLGEGPDGLVWQAHGKPDDLILQVTRVEPTTVRRPPAIVLPMLAGRGALRVHLLDVATEAGHPAPDAPVFAAMRDGGVVYSGDWLAQAGLPTPAMKAESAALFRIEPA
ncbi:alpha-galactosidase [Sphingomonas sp. PP-F2F-G114-C0414]|uniref:alpha-galactosidase n=1 Tax=Sphingomonas sp. PP-F2F-G114-C0414 TaxID=2135662 RepID=UPI000F13901B|nr:alpha-galactosidase [Sphingomonas sp. PP-F2F-G114-C0414]RMB35797.1 alpha-galactosidase [Sphingomonas sp. PP-F2F-G114-C0414]